MNEVNAINLQDSLLLAGFNLENKENGFWKTLISSQEIPVKCTMGPYAYYFPSTSPSIDFSISEYVPQKAKNKNIFIVRRMNINEAPNLFLTTDFRFFSPITSISPQKNYNWLTSELVKWVMPDGKTSCGILYKPEDFDSSRAYPLIIHYYEKNSDGLNVYTTPELSEGALKIPWYVSNGFLVFVPDIHYVTGHVGESIVLEDTRQYS
jgi:dipeptidyl aminopeptidase/acylaminoacyl peptidase